VIVRNDEEKRRLSGISCQPSQKIQKTSKSLLTHSRGVAYIRLNNDSGTAAGDQEVRF